MEGTFDISPVRPAPRISGEASISGSLSADCAASWSLGQKGGKWHEMPAHHNLGANLEAAKLVEAKKMPLFRSARGRTGEMTETAMHRIDAYRMIRRRARDADVCCHTFRAIGITAYLENGGTLETPRLWQGMKVPVRRNYMIAPETKSRSMKSSASRFEFKPSAHCTN